jgi:hypothetical protein
LQQSPKELNINIHLYDEFGIGGGASGISGGLLHPYSPKGTYISHLQLTFIILFFLFFNEYMLMLM